jgi:hypothetical protein
MSADREPQQNLLFPNDESAVAPLPCRDLRKPGADESHWLELNLYESEGGIHPVGGHAMLYCGACEASVAYRDVVPGPIRDWPYCPVHQDKTLMVCSTSLGLPDGRHVETGHEAVLSRDADSGSNGEKLSSN